MLYNAVKAIAHRKVIAFFSTGKDSCVMLDLISKYVRNYEIVHFYFYNDLEIRERVLRWYELKTGKQILRLPHPEKQYLNDRAAGKKSSDNVCINDVEPYLRNKYGPALFAYGHRRAESLTRRAILGRCVNGIDGSRCYPVIDFTKPQILAYIKQEGLLLPDDYQWGFNDINVFKGNSLIWLYMQHRKDYDKIKQEYSFIEGDLLKAIWESKR